jgi:hypothetical protein
MTKARHHCGLSPWFIRFAVEEKAINHEGHEVSLRASLVTAFFVVLRGLCGKQSQIELQPILGCTSHPSRVPYNFRYRQTDEGITLL